MSAGSATVAFAPEPSYLAAPTDPTYVQPGYNITVGEVSLQRALQRLRDPNNPEPIQSIAQNVEGALSVSFDLAGDEWHQLVFNNTDNTGFEDGRMPSSRWWLGTNALPGVTERVPKGAVVADAQIQYQQGQPNRVQLTLIYGDEEKNSSITPSSIQKPSADDVYPFHGAELTLDTVAQAKLQSATLGISPNARFHRGPSQHPLDAVIGNVEHTLTMAAIFEEDDNLSAAYGSASATAVEDNVATTDGSLAFENAAGTTLTYNLTAMQPNQYGWSDLVAGENDLNEEIDYHVASVGVA